MTSSADEIITQLGLQPHPKEGGFFKEIYRATETIPPGVLPSRYEGARVSSTAIYYLLTPGTFSHLHTVASDELFHFYVGDPVEMIHLHADGTGARITIGSDISQGHTPVVVVPQGVWQGCRLRDGGAFALMGFTVAPGFEYSDYGHADRQQLIDRYPEFAEDISALTDA